MSPWFRSAAKNAMQHIWLRGRFIWHLPSSEGAAALTFDDGPDPVFTPRVLDLLARFGLRATFFLVGSQVRKHPHIVKRLVQEGHHVGSHTLDHREIVGLPAKELIYQLNAGAAAIGEACGVRTDLFRPPRGRMDFSSIRTVCRAGYRLVHWSVTASDYQRDGTAPLIQRLERARVRAGDIVLLHDNNSFTIEALEQVIPLWMVSGLRLQVLPYR